MATTRGSPRRLSGSQTASRRALRTNVVAAGRHSVDPISTQLHLRHRGGKRPQGVPRRPIPIGEGWIAGRGYVLGLLRQLWRRDRAEQAEGVSVVQPPGRLVIEGVIMVVLGRVCHDRVRPLGRCVVPAADQRACNHMHRCGVGVEQGIGAFVAVDGEYRYRRGVIGWGAVSARAASRAMSSHNSTLSGP